MHTSHFNMINKKQQDVVEVQLLREVAARSDAFFRAASQLQVLRAALADTNNGTVAQGDLFAALAAAAPLYVAPPPAGYPISST